MRQHSSCAGRAAELKTLKDTLGRALAALGRGQAVAVFLQDKPVAAMNETCLHPVSDPAVEPLY